MAMLVTGDTEWTSEGVPVAAWLRGEGYEVFSVFDEARGIEDDKVIQKAYDENWILITQVRFAKPKSY